MNKKIVIILIVILGSLLIIESVLRIGNTIYKLIYRVPKYEDSTDVSILCIGESTTWGIGASNPLKENYPHQLEQMLSRRFPNKRIKCFFDRTIGQNTSEILLKFPGYIRKYQPDIVIFMVGINNWWNLDKSNILLFNQNNKISNFTLKTLVFLDKFKTWKLFKWIFYSIRGYKERWNYGISSEPIEVSKKCVKTREEYDFHIFTEVAKHDLTEMVRICKNLQIKVIICSYPFFDEEMGLYEMQKEVAKKNEVIFVDNVKLFDNLPNKKDYFASNIAPGHPNSKGYRLLAENIYNCILKNKLVE